MGTRDPAARERGFLVPRSREHPGPWLNTRHLPPTRGMGWGPRGRGVGRGTRGVGLRCERVVFLAPRGPGTHSDHEMQVVQIPLPLGHGDWLRNGHLARPSPSEASLDLGLRVLAVVPEPERVDVGPPATLSHPLYPGQGDSVSTGREAELRWKDTLLPRSLWFQPCLKPPLELSVTYTGTFIHLFAQATSS